MPKYVLFDTETTGNSEEDRIIQIGAMVVNSKTDIEIYDELCYSDIPIKTEAMEVHNITPGMIEGKPKVTHTEFWVKLNELNSSENYLIAHNINFDLDMIKKEGFESHYKLIDTLRCARHLLDDLTHHRLQFLRYALEIYKNEQEEANRLGITIKAHDAIGDVLIMKLLLSHLVKKVQERFKGINPMEKLAELTITPVFVKTFKFGKYKGQETTEIALQDPGYLNWMRNNMELDEDMRFTLNKLLTPE